MQRQIILIASAILLFVAGCGSSSPSQPAATKTIRGLLTKVEPVFVPGSTVPPQAFTVRGDDGAEVTMRIGAKVDTNNWNGLHMNSHLLNREPLLVTYEEVGGTVQALALDDA